MKFLPNNQIAQVNEIKTVSENVEIYKKFYALKNSILNGLVNI